MMADALGDKDVHKKIYKHKVDNVSADWSWSHPVNLKVLMYLATFKCEINVAQVFMPLFSEA